ncbi:hypothetical protein GGF43_004984, partial [Coemansia sp. RSA 2618]
MRGIGCVLTLGAYASGVLAFYIPSLIKRPWLNIGEVLRGDRIASVPCTKTLTAVANEEAGRLLEQDNIAEWFVDKLPSATAYLQPSNSSSSLP